MSSTRQSDSFKLNFFFWKLFGIWSGRTPSKFYKYYSFFYLFITFFFYNILLTINLIYTPLKIELLIREVIFYGTEVIVTSKVFMIILMRNKIIEVFDLLDCEEFEADDEESKEIIDQSNSYYITYWKMYAIVSNVAYFSQVLLSILVHFIWEVELELPICKYYFLSDDFRKTYFIHLFIYQSFGMYGHMMYNVNIDSFIAGVIWMAITQLRVLYSKLYNFKVDSEILNLKTESQDQIQVLKLNRLLWRYDLILKYYSRIQNLLSLVIFIQFGMASINICVVLCGFTLPSSSDTLVFMATYLFAMTSQIFVPAWLGTQLRDESQELMFAAYNSEWIPRSESLKRSIMLFMQRAKIPIELTGLKMVPLSLDTFISIMKSAYSCFTLIRNVQNGQEGGI